MRRLRASDQSAPFERENQKDVVTTYNIFTRRHFDVDTTLFGRQRHCYNVVWESTQQQEKINRGIETVEILYETHPIQFVNVISKDVLQEHLKAFRKYKETTKAIN